MAARITVAALAERVGELEEALRAALEAELDRRVGELGSALRAELDGRVGELGAGLEATLEATAARQAAPAHGPDLREDGDPRFLRQESPGVWLVRLPGRAGDLARGATATVAVKCRNGRLRETEVVVAYHTADGDAIARSVPARVAASA